MRYLELIQETALQAPETVAVVTSEGQTMTYGELWCASESLAAWLDASADAQAPVMVYGNKEPLMVACFLACMKSGHPYVPIDCHSVPADQVASIASQLAGKAPGVVLQRRAGAIRPSFRLLALRHSSSRRYRLRFLRHLQAPCRRYVPAPLSLSSQVLPSHRRSCPSARALPS